jgi:hypothetical protein
MVLAGVSAARAGVSGTNGAAVFVSNPPADVSSNQWESNTQVRVFAEQQGLTLSQPLGLDISVAGTSPGATDDNLSPATLAAGSVVSSYEVHFDPNGQRATDNALAATGSVTFDQPILGLIINATDLNSTNSVLGLAGVTYPDGPDHGLDIAPGAVGTGTADQITLSADMRTVTFDLRAASFADDFRVVTATPEPGTVLLVGMGAAGLVCRRRRARG